MDTVDRESRLAALAGQIAAVQGRRGEHSDGDGPSAHESSSAQTVQPDQTAQTAQTAQMAQTAQTAQTAQPDQMAAAKAICLRLLAVAPRPRAGLAQALRRKEIPDSVADAVLDRLAEVGLIDDAAYANSFVRTRHRDRALGRTALRTELRKLGVAEEVTAEAIDTVDAQAERTRAVELIAKRLDSAMAAGAVAGRRRLLALLDRRGYPSEVAISVVESALEGYAKGESNSW